MAKPEKPYPGQPPIMPTDTLPAIDWLLEHYIPEDRKTPKLLAAIARYKKAASEPPAIVPYIDRHLKDGLTHDEWTIFTTGLALRVMPTLGDLFNHESEFRAANFHSSALTPNYLEEGGDGKNLDCHPELYFDSLHVVGHKLGVTTASQAAIYAMALHIIELRRLDPPVLFPPVQEPPSSITPGMNNIQADVARVKDMNTPGFADAMRESDRAFERFKREVPKINGGRPLILPQTLGDMNGVPKGKGDMVWIGGAEKSFGPMWFRQACQIAALLPDESINYYKAVNADKSAHHPNDALDLLTRELNTLTREGNAPTHIGAYDRLVRAHAGYFGSDAKRAQFWSDIHVNPKTGVEKSHETALIERFLSILRSNLLDKQIDPDAIAEVFDHVVDRGYIAQQKQHWEAVVASMEQARAASTTPPIPPKAKGRFADMLDARGLAQSGLSGWFHHS